MNENVEAINFLRRSTNNKLTMMEARKLLRNYDNNVEKCLEFFHSNEYKRLYRMGKLF